VQLKVKNLYLLAYYVQVPKDPKQTHIPGYVKNPDNLRWDESVEITLGLKTKDELKAAVVLDLTNEKVVKNRYNPETTYQEWLDFYDQAHPDYLREALERIGRASKFQTMRAATDA
jgi:hypothetical protein